MLSEHPYTTNPTALHAIRDELETGSGAVMLRGLDLSEYSEEEAQKLFLDLAQHIGTPVSQSANGERLFPVRDAGFASDDPRSRGPNTAKKLSFHTDRCDVIGFLCWKQAQSGGENEVVSSIALRDRIAAERPDLLKILQQPFPYKRHTIDPDNPQPWIEQPIFSECDGHFACAFLRVLIDRAHADPALPDLTPEQIEALDFLEATAADPALHHRFRQEPGDILFLNNWTTLHRRTAFVDHVAPAEKRCLFRIWLSPPNSRPLDPAFAANFGSVEAGAVRGGIWPSK